MQLFELPGLHYGLHTLTFSPDGRLLAGWSWSAVWVIETPTGTIRTIWVNSQQEMVARPGLGFTSDSQNVIVHNKRAGTTRREWVHVRDVRSGELRQDTMGDFTAGAAIPGGGLVYLGIHARNEKNDEIVPWDPLTGEMKPGFGKHACYLQQLAVSMDGQWVAGWISRDIRVWDIQGGKLPRRAVRNFRLDQSSANAVALSADGTYLAADGHSVWLWDVRTGKGSEIDPTYDISGRGLAFAPDRPILAYGSGNAVVFWDAEAGAEVKRFNWDVGKVSSVAFAPDGLRCALSGDSGKVVVWDVDV